MDVDYIGVEEVVAHRTQTLGECLYETSWEARHMALQLTPSLQKTDCQLVKNGQDSCTNSLTLVYSGILC